MKNLLLNNWEKATQELVKYFCQKHFGKTADWYFIGDEVGGVVSVADYFFGLDSIILCTRYKYTSQEVFDYSDYALQKYVYPLRLRPKRSRQSNGSRQIRKC